MRPKLCVAISRNGEPIDVVPFEGDRLKIGRLLSTDVYLEDSTVARLHALIERTASELRVIDLGTASGTKVAGVAVERQHAVALHQPIEIGPFVLRIQPAAPTAHHYGPVEPSSPAEPTRGDHVAEVMATFGDTVIDVRHIGTPGRRRRAWPLLAAGSLVSLIGFGAFAHDVAMPWDDHAARVAQAAERGLPTPCPPGIGWPLLGFVLGLAGLVPMTAGAMRRRDPELTSYTIGEAPDVVLSTPGEGLPDRGRHALVEVDPQGLCVHLAATMRLRTWRHGVPHEHVAHEGAALVPIGTRGVIEFGALSFHVQAVAPGERIGRRRELDKPFWLYNAGVGLIGSLFLLLAMLSVPDGSSMAYDEDAMPTRFAGYFAQPDESPPSARSDLPDDGPIASTAPPGQSARGESGAMGSRTAKLRSQRYAMRGPADATPIPGRLPPVAGSERAGILGIIAASDATMIASVDGSAFAVGNDDAELWGNLHGVQQGEAFGLGGLGLTGTGRHGGGTAEGVIGLGRVGLIGGLPGGGGSARASCRGRDCGTVAFVARPVAQPKVRVLRVDELKGMDEAVIRRVVRAHINEVRHCYNQGLIDDPNLNGRVAIQFTIGPNGRVVAAVVASSTLPDRQVANCIAAAVRRWVFPAPPLGGTALVTYPFVLQPG